MPFRFTSVVLVALLLTACESLLSGPATTTTSGVTYPPLKPVGGVSRWRQPPGAWLIVGDTAFPATYGSFCYRGTCADMVAPQMMRELATASVPGNANLAIRIASMEPVSLEASVRKWTREPTFDPSGERQFQARGEREGKITVYTLGPIGDEGDQLLTAFVRFAQGGDASYLWRLNPKQ